MRMEPGEEEEELDEDTRRFNFWTHQVHIFFTRKFFDAAEHLIRIKKLLEGRLLEDSLRRVSMAPSALSSAAPPAETSNPAQITTGHTTPKVRANSAGSTRVAA